MRNGEMGFKRCMTILLCALMLLANMPLSAFAASTGKQPEIATWEGWRTAAATFTFDDGAPSHVTDVAPMFDRYGYKATFNLVVDWGPNWSGFQKLADNGHEIASHSNTHPTNMKGEEASSKAAIEAKIKSPYGCLTVAYPNCNIPDSAAVEANYIAGRIGNGSWQGVPDIMSKDGPAKWYQLPALMTGSTSDIKTAKDFESKIEQAIAKEGWVVFLTHGLTGKQNGAATYSPTDLGEIESTLLWAKQHDSEVWVTSMCNAAMYIKERNASKITEKSSTVKAVTYTLTHEIADSICKYQYPLSVRVPLTDGWSLVEVKQGSEKLDSKIEDGMIYFRAIPNGGDIIVSRLCDQKNHLWDEGVVTSEPTTSAEGVKTYTCICGATKTESIEKLASVTLQKQTITVSKKCKKTVTYKASSLKAKKATLKISAKAKTKLSYKVTKGNKKYITVSKKGEITLKKGCKKGTYKVTVSAEASQKYAKATKVITIKVK